MVSKTCHAVLGFQQSGCAQITNTRLAGCLGNLDRIASSENDLGDGFADRHHLVYAGTAFVAVIATRAAGRIEKLQSLVDFCLRIAFGEQRGSRQWRRHRLFAIVQAPRQALGDDQRHR
jgi:hypothetical protein